MWVNSNSMNTLHFFIRNPTNGYLPLGSVSSWWEKNAEGYLDEKSHQDELARKRSEAAKRGWETRRARERMALHTTFKTRVF